jgi:thiamine pyrophosphate-dependent acetolactate synthase large subunit-like protein
MTANTQPQSTGVYLTRLLKTYDVEVIFGIPGVHTVELYRGLDGSGLRHVTPRHEQGAGFMADGYARASGKPGVCFIISGPGMTNIITAMGQAYGDSIPMLVISTVNAHGRMGSGEGWLHEMPNQSAMVAGVSAFSRTVNRRWRRHSRSLTAPARARFISNCQSTSCSRMRRICRCRPIPHACADLRPRPRGSRRQRRC